MKTIADYLDIPATWFNRLSSSLIGLSSVGGAFHASNLVARGSPLFYLTVAWVLVGGFCLFNALSPSQKWWFR